MKPCRFHLVFVLTLCLSALATAQTATPTDDDRRARLNAAWIEAYDAKDYETAETNLRELITLAPDDAIAHYNLACVLALQQKIDAGETALKKAVALGFSDFARMEKDETLANLRGTRTYKAVLLGRAVLQEASIDDRLDRYRKQLVSGKKSAEERGYSFSKDETLRLGFVSAFSKRGLEDTKAEIIRCTNLWKSAVLPPEAAAPEEKKTAPWVLVYLPNANDYEAWAKENFGTKARNIGGLYDNHKQELTSRDLGPTLRHEFWHVLHYRHMGQLNQFHTPFVQEGIASLVEDIEWVDDEHGGTLKPVTSWRSNMAKRMLGNNLLPKLGAAMAADHKTFGGGRTLGYYAAARTFFLWMSEQGKLREWYAAYTRDFNTDPTGVKTTENLLGKPIAKIDTDFRAWVKALKDVGEVNIPGAAVLPLALRPIGGEGLLVESVTISERGGNALLKVQPGDIIVAIAGKPVRDHTEMARRLDAFKSGEKVDLTVRRAGRDLTITVTLARYG